MKLPLDTGSLFYETLGHGEPPILLMLGGLGLDHTVLRPWLDPLAESRGSGHWPYVEEADRCLNVIREWVIG